MPRSSTRCLSSSRHSASRSLSSLPREPFTANRQSHGRSSAGPSRGITDRHGRWHPARGYDIRRLQRLRQAANPDGFALTKVGRDKASRRVVHKFNAGSLALAAGTGAIGAGGITTGIRAVVSRVITKAYPLGSAALKRDPFHISVAWLQRRILFSGSVRITRVSRTNSWGLSVSVRGSVNSTRGTQNWVVGRGYLVHSFLKGR